MNSLSHHKYANIKLKILRQKTLGTIVYLIKYLSKTGQEAAHSIINKIMNPIKTSTTENYYKPRKSKIKNNQKIK